MTEELLAEVNTTCALTDLGAGLILLPMIAVIACRKVERRDEKRLWLLFFAMLAASCLLGFVAHYYCTGILFRILWVPLYAMMFESVASFFLLALYRLRGRMPRRVIVIGLHAIVLLAYLPIMILDTVFDRDMIRVFVIVAAVLGLTAFAIMIRCALRKGSVAECIVVSALFPLLAAVYFQIRRAGFVRIIWAFDCNGISHLFIILALCLLFAGSLVALRRTERE